MLGFAFRTCSRESARKQGGSPFIVYGTLIPFDMVLDPALIRDRREQVDLSFFYHLGKRASLPDLVSNLLLFIPMGFLIYANLGHNRARAVPKILVCLMLGFLLSLTVETCQLFIRDLTASLDDVAMNALGALVGGTAAAIFFPLYFQRIVGLVRRNLDRRPAALILGRLLELAQSAVVSRSPDLTDAMVCAAGTWAGTFLGCRYRAWEVQPEVQKLRQSRVEG